jgi:hypothetical protein
MNAAARRLELFAVLGGVALGIAYTLSPLTVLMLPLIALLASRVGRDLPTRERRWLHILLAAAVAARLLAIAGLFLSADDAKPFATFFGDEEMFKFRSIWLRNIGLDVPISAADYIYAVGETGKSHYLFVLAYLQALVGAAPYGVHVFNMTVYVAAVLLLYRSVRASYGHVVSFAGVAVLLCLPSLFIWSISALKEPLYALLAATELLCALHIVRSSTWTKRLLSVIAVIALGIALERLRKGGLLVACIGTVAGLIAAFILTRPRLLLVSLVAGPIAVIALLFIPAIQERVLDLLRDSASYHVGHVFTPGYSYRTLETVYYIDPGDIPRMPFGEAVEYAFWSVVAYVVQPVPWMIESRAALAYLPEHVLWLTMAALVPVGAATALRRDAVLTSLLLTHAFVLIMMVALTSGNIGTLIRHRGLALPYLVWLSALGACEVCAWLAARSAPIPIAYATR